MKITTILSLLSLALMSTACVVKTESTSHKIEAPQVEKIEVYSHKVQGKRCDLIGTESKEIFLEISPLPDGKKTVMNIFDLDREGKISVEHATVEGFITQSIFLDVIELDGQTRLTAKDNNLFRTSKSIINSDKKVIRTTATFDLDQDFIGTIGIKYFVYNGDKTFSHEDAPTPVGLENCVDFEAKSLI